MKGKGGRILISLIGVLFILWAVLDLSLGIWGKQALGTVTTVRRQGGERGEAIPNRYLYSIGYEFATAEGDRHSGSYQKVGDAVYVKADGSTAIAIRYFPFLPQLNTPDKESRLSLRQPLLVLVGLFLLFFVNQQPDKKKKQQKK